MSNIKDLSIDDSIELDESSVVTEGSIIENSDILENTYTSDFDEHSDTLENTYTTDFDEHSEVTENTIMENSDILENTSSTTELDELTLSLLMNKTRYRKYIEQTDPEKNELNYQNIKYNRQYRSKILEITARMIDTPDVQITTDVDKMFVAYTKTLVQYFQMKELERHPEYKNDDVLFGSIDETPSSQPLTNSLWGKERVLKGKSTIANYDMRMFSKR
jgi:hypothetical protein